MLETILSSVAETLAGEKLPVVRQYPAKRRALPGGSAVCVGLKSSTITPAGSGGYLGLRENEDGSVSELYALRAETVVTLDIYEPLERGTGACLERFEALSAALGKLPGGLRANTIVCGAPEPDSLTEMLRCPVEMHCTAFLTARADEDSGEFTDFVLRGVLKHGDQ